ncbi:MAG: hypothetical protein ABJC39_01780 [Chloroflexota bacterium]
MADQTLPEDRTSDTVCPWCSAAITPTTAICPSCGAILISDEEKEVPGLTAVDLAVLRGEKKAAPTRNRLLSWISGDYPDEDAPIASDSVALAPPEPEVQREILRLQLEADVANLQAEADSLLSEAVVEGRLDELPEDVRPMAEGEFSADPSETSAFDTGTPTDPAAAARRDATTQADTAAEDEAPPPA